MTRDPESLLCDARFNAVVEIAAACAQYGDLAEFGAYKGGTSVALAEVARKAGRRLYIFDHWKGISAPTLPGEIDLTGALASPGLYCAVKLRDAGLLDFCTFMRVDLTTFNRLDVSSPFLGFALVDLDMAKPTASALQICHQCVVHQGAVIVDDYLSDRLTGVKTAVDLLFDTSNPHIIHGTPDSAILLRKEL